MSLDCYSIITIKQNLIVQALEENQLSKICKNSIDFMGVRRYLPLNKPQ